MTLGIFPKLRCIYAGSGAQFDYITWMGFTQAIRYDSSEYNDYKSITHCSFKGNLKDTNSWMLPLPDEDSGLEDDIYAFDLSGLGDVLVFNNNEVGTFLAKQKMLKINQCGGGTINDNVINGDISVVSSKGLSITNNHLENGAQIYINSSVVSLKENYIEKGKRPSILIRSGQNDNYDIYIQSVVNMTGDQFLYFNRNRGSENSETEQTGRHLKEARLNSISDTDILIDRSAILNLDNVYRYDMVVGFGSINPLGIKIDPFEENDFFRFNDYSYILSQKGSISRNEQLRGSVFYRNLNSTYLYAPMVSNWVEWYRPSGSYRYYYAIIWDRQRGIFRHNSSDQIYTLLTQTPIALTKYGKGMQFGTGVDSGKDAEGLIAGANYLIQLIRCRIDASGNPIMDSYEHVTIPLAGSRIIYDNGISVCGYKWEAGIVPGLDIDLGLPKYETYSFNSGHVEAAAYTRPQKPYSGWQKGDLITNIGDESDWTIEIIK